MYYLRLLISEIDPPPQGARFNSPPLEFICLVRYFESTYVASSGDETKKKNVAATMQIRMKSLNGNDKGAINTKLTFTQYIPICTVTD